MTRRKDGEPMTLSNLSPPTLRVIAAALECKKRYGLLGPGAVRKLANVEPGASVEDALNVLGFGVRLEVETDTARIA
jgi:hypothetical protein